MRSLVAAITFATLGGIAFADVTTLNPIRDLRILSINPDGNDNGSGLSTINGAGNIQRTLIQFDYSGLSGATITSATLRLRGASYTGSTLPTSIDVYRLVSSWTETQATWNRRDSANLWTNPGGDAVGTGGSQLTDPYTHWTGNGSALSTWVEMDATSVVQGAVQGSFSNNGLLLAGQLFNTMYFVSREGNNFGGDAGLASQVPELVVTFTPVPEPASLALLGLGAAAFFGRKRF